MPYPSGTYHLLPKGIEGSHKARRATRTFLKNDIINIISIIKIININYMNTYKKYSPNVFVAKCPEEHSKGDTIIVTTKYGKENESIVHNLVGTDNDGNYYYSFT